MKRLPMLRHLYHHILECDSVEDDRLKFNECDRYLVDSRYILILK